MQNVDEVFSALAEEQLEACLQRPAEQAVILLRKSFSPEVARTLAGFVDSLQRYRKKLPEWYVARCRMPRALAEQATGSRAAGVADYPTGVHAWDLTAGLGSDTLALARRFERVSAVEADPLNASLLPRNLARLKCKNVEVYQQGAEAFLQTALRAGFPEPDFIFLDPARRTDARTGMLLPEQLSPALPELLPLLDRFSSATFEVKLSPRLDAGRLPQYFGERPLQIRYIGVGSEVKSLRVRWGANISEPLTIKVLLDLPPRKSYTFKPQDSTLPAAGLSALQQARFVADPHPAFIAAGVNAQLANAMGLIFNHQHGVLWAGVPPEAFPGQLYRICYGPEIFNPRSLKRWLRQERIGKIWVLKRGAPLSPGHTLKKLAVRQGGAFFLLLTPGETGQTLAAVLEKLPVE